MCNNRVHGDEIERMCNNGVHGDEICLQIFANLVGRDIIYIPFHQCLAHIIKQYCLIRSDSREADSDPLALFWYEEHKFSFGHLSVNCASVKDYLILKHYGKQNSFSSSSHPTHYSLITRMTLGSINSDIPVIQFVINLLYL